MGSNKAGRGKRTEKGGEPRIEQYHHWGKNTMRSFPESEGCPFWLPKGAAEKDLFDMEEMVNRMTHKDEELLYRVEYGISETAAMLDLLPWLRDQWDNKALKDFHELFSDQQDFLNAVSYLNTGTAVERDDDATEKHMAALIDFCQENAEKHARTTRKLSMFFCRGYLAVMGLHKMFAFCANPKAWAKRVERKKELPSSFKKWVRSPTDTEKMVQALADCMKLHPKFTKKVKKSNTLSDSDDQKKARKRAKDDSDDSDSDSSAAESVPRKLGKAGKKKASDKKTAKGSTSEEEDKKLAKKAKKDKKKEKKSGKSDFASSDTPPREGKRRARGKDADEKSQRGRKRARSVASEAEERSGKATGSKRTVGKTKRGQEETRGDDSSSEPQAVDTPVDLKSLVLQWSLQQMMDFRSAIGVTFSEEALLAVPEDKRRTVVDALPMAIRTAKLPSGFVFSDAKNYKNQEDWKAAVTGIVLVVQEADSAWLEQAECFNVEKHGWTIQEDLEGHGLLKLLAQQADYLVNKQEVDTLLATLDEEGGDRAAKLAAASSMQEAVLRTQVMDEGASAAVYTSAIDFAKKYAGKEPTVKDLRPLLGALDTNLRAALGIADDSKYASIKARTWKQDVSRFLTVAYLSHLSWHRAK